MKKLNFLMLFALAFLFLGCRHDVMHEDDHSLEISSFQQTLKLKDVPALKNIINANPHLLSNDYSIEANDNMKVLHIENEENNSYSIQFIPPNVNSFYSLILNYNKKDNNKESYTLIEFAPKDKRGNANINNFSGDVYFKTLDRRVFLSSKWENGKIIKQENDNSFRKTSCYTDYNVVEVWCSENIHSPSQYGICQASGKPYYSITSTLKCHAESIDPGDGGGGSFGGGGGIGGGLGIWDILMPFPDIKNLYMNLPSSIRLSLNNYYQENGNSDFAYFAIAFFANNSNISWTQFQNWFIDGYSENYRTKLSSLTSAELQDFININTELETSPYEEEFIKETNEAYVAFTAYADIDNMSDAQIQYVLNNNCCAGLFIQQFTLEQSRLIVANYHFNRKYYPEWGKGKCFWEASREVIQLVLDLGGMVPVIGEVCDLTNATIYAIYGDGLNASLSAAGAIPIAGWFATGTKYGIKIVNASDIASRQVLKWIVGTDGIIKFGYRSQLRKVLKLIDKTKHAHHIIPWEFANYPIIQKAAKSPNAFHLNEALNGMPLQSTGHLTGHQAYNTKVGQVLTILNNGNPSSIESYQRLIGFNNYLRNLISNNPTLNLGQIADLINYP